jgi:hypothetical protein
MTLAGRDVELTLVDLDEGLLLVGMPDDLSVAERTLLADTLSKRSTRKIVLVAGSLLAKWAVYRLVPQEQYDADFGEVRG